MFHPALLSLGTPDEVAAYCRKLIDEIGRDGGLVLQAGCSVPYAVTPENFRAMIETGKDAGGLVSEMGLEQISDQGALDPVITRIIEENQKAVQDYRGGKKAALGALVGQVMRHTRGKADPKLAGRLLRERLDAMQ